MDGNYIIVKAWVIIIHLSYIRKIQSQIELLISPFIFADNVSLVGVLDVAVGQQQTDRLSQLHNLRSKLVCSFKFYSI